MPILKTVQVIWAASVNQNRIAKICIPQVSKRNTRKKWFTQLDDFGRGVIGSAIISRMAMGISRNGAGQYIERAVIITTAKVKIFGELYHLDTNDMLSL